MALRSNKVNAIEHLQNQNAGIEEVVTEYYNKEIYSQWAFLTKKKKKKAKA